MKTLGLIGGMTWHSTVDYYRLINQGVHERLGGSQLGRAAAPVSIDFEPVEDLQDRGDWAGMGRLMVRAAQTLEGAGAEGHRHLRQHHAPLAARHEAAVRLPLIHIADADGAAAIKRRPGSGRSACSARATPWSWTSTGGGSRRSTA